MVFPAEVPSQNFQSHRTAVKEGHGLRNLSVLPFWGSPVALSPFAIVC